MSRLIDQLRASDFPNRSTRDLTLEVGEWLESNKRDDVFAQHPDFAQEFHDLKDEVARASRPSLGEEFRGSFGSAVDELQASGYAGLALAAHGAQKLGIPGAESTRNKLLELMHEQEAEAAEYRPSVGSYDEIKSGHLVDDVLSYLSYGAGTLGPSMLQSAGAAAVGAAIGGGAGSTAAPGPGTAVGAVGGALLGLAERRLAQKVLSRLVGEGVKTTLTDVARSLPREAITAEAKRLAVQYASQGALALSSIQMETGSIYKENPEAPGIALAYGVPAGLLDVLPEAMIAGRFLGAGKLAARGEAERAVGYFRRFVGEAAKNIPLEGGTETAQTLLEIAAAKQARGESPTSFTRDDWRQAVNAGIIGAIGGAGMSGVSAIANPAADPDILTPLTNRIVEGDRFGNGGLPIPSDASPGGTMDFGAGNEIPEGDVAGFASLPAEVVGGFNQNATAEAQRFGAADTEPFSLGAAEPETGLPDLTASPSLARTDRERLAALPPEVRKGVKAAEKAAHDWEIANASTEPFPGEQAEAREFPQFGTTPLDPAEQAALAPQSETIRDAQLQELIGTQVEYQGYRGQLVRDREGNFMVMPSVRDASKPFWVEVSGTGKDPTLLASEVAVTPLEAVPMQPKAPPAVAIPGAGQTAPGPAPASKVPLGEFFPSDLVPRRDINLPPTPAPIAPHRLPGPPPASTTPPTPAVPPTGAVSPLGSTGADIPVENAPESKSALSYEGQLATWKQQNRKPKGRSVIFGPLPDGTKDILNVIYDEYGGIAPKKKGAEGGEHDDVAANFTGAAKMLIRKGGASIDTVATGLGFSDVKDLNAAVSAAAEQRRIITAAYEKQNRDFKQQNKESLQRDRFIAAAVENKSRPKSQIGKPIQAGELAVGDKAKFKREPVEVIDIDPDTEEVVIRDGDRFGTQKVSSDTVLYPDKRTLRRVPRSEATFLDEEDTIEEAPTESGEIQFTVQQPQEFGGRTIPGYVQIERQADNGRGEPLTDEQRGAAMQALGIQQIPTWIPTGQYTATQLRELLTKGPPPTLAGPGLVQTPQSGEQAEAAAGNGVPSAPQDSIPNLRRIRIFERPAAPAEQDPNAAPIENPTTVEANSIEISAKAELKVAVGKKSKAESNVAVVLVDRATGQAYQRTAYAGPSNSVYVDLASARRGNAGIQGSTVSQKADFERGTEGRPIDRILEEKLADGTPRYVVYGIGELQKPGAQSNWNLGQSSGLDSHAGITAAAKRYWSEEARNRNARSSTMPAATDDLVAFPHQMATWRRENPGEVAGDVMLRRIRDFAAIQAKGYGGKITEQQLGAWVTELRSAIEQMASVEQKQAMLISADYRGTSQAAQALYRSTLSALVQDRTVDVVALGNSLARSANAAAATTGIVMDQDGGRRILAYAVSSVTGPVNADTVLGLLHETAHHVTDGIPEPLRVAFHEAVNRMPDARWIMNPRSLDIRVLANAEPSQLSPEQRAALEELTPEEIAAARRVSREELTIERAAEHLAQLGWDKSEARGAFRQMIRFAKEVWLRVAMAIQRAFKGEQHVSPELARQYVENRFLRFVHNDSAVKPIHDLLNWLGVPIGEKRMIPYLPGGRDGDTRMQYVDIATGQLIPVGHATFTPDAQMAYLQAAIQNAERFIRENPTGTAAIGIKQQRRAAFSAPLSFTPSLQTNTVFAAVNLEGEIYRQIQSNPDIAPLLPPGADFIGEWLKVPDRQSPMARRMEAETWAKKTTDPTTGAPVAYDADMSVDNLPSAEESIVDNDGRTVTVKLTEAQDKALQQTIAAIGDTQARLQRRINHEADRIDDLERLRKRNPADFPPAALRQLDELKESLPLRLKIAAALTVQKNALISKFQPSDLVKIYPTGEYLTVPGPDATEDQIRAARRGVVPRDLKFTDKTQFAGHLAAMEAWLLNPDNRIKGQIYGVISEQYRKLNDIPTDLARAGTFGILRRSITGSFVDELRASGLPALRLLAKKFYEAAAIITRHSSDFSVEGDRWSTAFAKFAEAVGEQPDQGFRERVWDPMMRIWNFIDVSERNRIGTGDEGNLFTRIEGALKNATGIDINSAPRRSALRGLLMASIDSERQIRSLYEQNPSLKVKDEEMGIYRRLISHGLVTGRRSVARHMSGLFQRMNPAWSDTRGVSGEDPRSFWTAAGDLYGRDRTAFDERMKELFGDGYVLNDFVEPIVLNNTQIFEIVDEDGVTRKASLLRVREAWQDAGRDVTTFAQRLHALEGGKPGDEARTIQGVVTAFRRMFEEIKSDQDSKNGAEASGTEILPRQMMDARVANDWPAEWVSYATYAKADNLQLLHQLGIAAAFGRDAIAGNGELAQTIHQAKEDLAALYFNFDQHFREGKSPREIERLMGKDDYVIAKNAQKIGANLDRVETAFRSLSATTNYLSGDFKLLNDILGFSATMMVQNPRGSLANTSDILGSLVALKLSRPGLSALKKSIHSLAADFGNGVLQAFGQNAAFNVDSARRRVRAGVKDPDLRTTWREKRNNYGPGQSLAKPSGYEGILEKAKRKLTAAAVKGRDIIPNLGSPWQGTSDEQTLSPKLRWGFFPNWAMSTMNANIDAAYEVFADMAARGVDRINAMPASDRAAYVREIELGIRDITAEELGYHGGLILNDRAAFDSLKSALETKIAGEKGVGSFVAKAFRRHEAAAGGEWEAVSNSQFTGILNYANTEWTLQNNFASLPPWMQAGPLRPLFVFLTWPYNAMRRFGKTFTDPDGRLIWWGANSTVADGMKAFFLVAAPATVAGSFAIDWYDKYLLGKKQNLRETSWTTALPIYGAVTDPAAFIERVGRYGSAGFATDILNQIVNYDTQRNLSLDNRIVAINAISGLVNSLVTTPIQQGGNITYSSVVRPFLQSIGGGGVLQYLQISNNLLGLNNQDAAINARINTGNYLRAAGHELNLPVRISRGPMEAPTPTTPYLQQMELAALVGNTDLFRDAYRSAVAAARGAHENAEKYVADAFAERHPLKRIFRTAPTETQYRRLLGEMDQYGATQVRAAINSYNKFLSGWFQKKPYFGRADQSSKSVEDLIRDANRINSREVPTAESLLAIP